MKGYDVLASGFGVVEAPTLDDEGALYFSDVSGGGVFRLEPSGAVTTIVPKRKGVGGIALHRDGGIVVSGRDVAHVKDGVTRTLLRGKDCPPPGPVMGFNDLSADHRGNVLVGAVQLDADGVKMPQNFIRIAAPSQGEVIYADVLGSNGVAVDVDRRRVFHVSTRAREIIVSQITDDDVIAIVGRFSTAEIDGIPDGLAIDADGYVWVAFYRGGTIARFSPTGVVQEKLSVPATMPTSLCFGGADMRDLYIATHDNCDDPALGGCVLLSRSAVPGVARLRVAI